MNSKILFPNRYRTIGLYLMILSSILGILNLFQVLKFNFLQTYVFAIFALGVNDSNVFFHFFSDNVANEIFSIIFILGALMVAFSKVKHEDEFIAKIRMESLVWSIYFNYAVLIFCILFFYGYGFFFVMVFNMFTTLIFFIIRFHFILYRSKKSLKNEE